jgi:hypothetical protein
MFCCISLSVNDTGSHAFQQEIFFKIKAFSEKVGNIQGASYELLIMLDRNKTKLNFAKDTIIDFLDISHCPVFHLKTTFRILDSVSVLR